MKYFGEITDCSDCPLEDTRFCATLDGLDAPCSMGIYDDVLISEIVNSLEEDEDEQVNHYLEIKRENEKIRRKKERAKEKAAITRILNADINSTIRNLRKTIKNLEEIKSMRKSQALLHSIFTNKKAKTVDNTDLDLKINKIKNHIKALEQEKKERAKRRKMYPEEVQE